MGEVQWPTKRKYIFLFITISTLTYFWYSRSSYNWFSSTVTSPALPGEKLILLWTPFYLENSLKAWKVDSGFPNCEYKCHFTLDKFYLPVSDAVVYHGYPEALRWLIGEYIMHSLPPRTQRNPNQVWIYHMGEPPAPHFNTYETLHDHYDFNWTMTYRTDSDIPYGYGNYDRIQPDSIENYTSVVVPPPIPDNRKLAVGLISECGRPSGRDAYIQQLQRSIPVHIYGKCGNFTCNRPLNCYKILADKYKFWLSFENSLCLDYVTEKLYLPMFYGAVPVYYGHPDGPKHAPPGSFIHTKNYQSPEALAKYLLHLDSHPEEYSKYFEWKKYYRIWSDGEIVTRAWCRVCTLLHGISTGQTQRKSYASVTEWFLRNNTNVSICIDPVNKY